MLVDEVQIVVKAGDGGDGAVSFRREKFVPRGGPDGGDGGDGGDIYLVADHNLNHLGHLAKKRAYFAEDGQKGGSAKKTGRKGKDLILKVPLGTQVFEKGLVFSGRKQVEKTLLLFDLKEPGQKVLLAKGGEGGFGNAHFKRPTFQTPRFAELGEEGEERECTLSLKMIAEVGLVGLPNAGKSTLLSVISSARPKIAAYPFTTLEPNLGMVERKGRRFLVADIPGLIEGASRGKGLGTAFLKHIERTHLLLHLIDAASPKPEEDFQTLNQELKSFSRELIKKPHFIVFTKMDTISPKRLAELKQLKLGGKFSFCISAVTHQGLDALLDAILRVLPTREALLEGAGLMKVFTLKDIPFRYYEIIKKGRTFLVLGDKIEKIVRKTDLDNEEAQVRLYKVMKRMGILSQLKKKGAKEGDKIEIAGRIIECREI